MKAVTPLASYVSLFSSGGIGDLGFKQAGFNCVASAELLSRRLEVQRLNGIAEPDDLICGDLLQPHQFNQVVQRAENWSEKHHQPISLLIATPPCQGMSVANHKKKNELSRNSLVVRSIEAVVRIRPLVFVFENVPAFIKTVCTGLDGENRSIGDEIERSLGDSYEFYSKTLRLQDFGSPSSRKRSITIGVRNDLSWVTPLDLFPGPKEAVSLRTLVGELPRLTEMDQIGDKDIFHYFRPYQKRMRPWISALKEGESAFDNVDPARRPHRVIDGTVVPNVRKNGDKYRRTLWDAIPPCVHTRSDILASQNTVHPEDDRVFSIRELMKMMGVPDDFKWFENQELAFQRLDLESVKKHESNIRQCLGEAVPVPITNAIASNVVEKLIGHMAIKGGKPRLEKKPGNTWSTIAQSAAYRSMDSQAKKRLSAYYTQPLSVFAVLKRAWKKFESVKRDIRVLEPSCGAGVFLAVLDGFTNSERAQVTALDLDGTALELATRVVSRLQNLRAELVERDYLKFEVMDEYHLVIGNPPFGRRPRALESTWQKDSELSVNFLIKAMHDGENVAFVFPKAILHASHFRSLRDKINESTTVKWLLDFGELAFPDVLVETIGLGISAKSGGDNRSSKVSIKSWPKTNSRTVQLGYICDEDFPSWVLYRDTEFDATLANVDLGLFQTWRDRKLSRRHAEDKGIRVLRGRNLGSNGELKKSSNDYRVSKETAKTTLDALHSKMMKSNFLAPNLSYYPRVVRYDSTSMGIPEGSCALLTANLTRSQEKNFVEFCSSKEFSRFYRVACNYATRSLNIDSSLAYWWAVPRPFSETRID